MALITESDVARHLGLRPDEDEEQILTTLIAAAQSAIEAVIGRSLNAATMRTEYYDAGRRYIYTNERPITSVSYLADDAQTSAREISSDDWINDSDDQGLNYRAGKVELWNDESQFGGGRLDVKIGYTAGWTASTLPGYLKKAWIELVAFWFNAPDRIGVTQAMGNGQNVTYDQNDIPAPIMQALRRAAGGVNR